jgi:hypothetical protein
LFAPVLREFVLLRMRGGAVRGAGAVVRRLGVSAGWYLRRRLRWGAVGLGLCVWARLGLRMRPGAVGAAAVRSRRGVVLLLGRLLRLFVPAVGREIL